VWLLFYLLKLQCTLFPTLPISPYRNAACCRHSATELNKQLFCLLNLNSPVGNAFGKCLSFKIVLLILNRVWSVRISSAHTAISWGTLNAMFFPMAWLVSVSFSLPVYYTLPFFSHFKGYFEGATTFLTPKSRQKIKKFGHIVATGHKITNIPLILKLLGDYFLVFGTVPHTDQLSMNRIVIYFSWVLNKLIH